MSGHYPGNSMIEYLLPAALVTVLVFASLPILGESFRQALVVPQGEGALQNKNLSMRTYGNVDPQTRFNFETEAGTSNTGSNARLESLKEDIETLGGNGTTNKLLAELEDSTRKLLAEGKITPEQANQLQILANKGHRLAELQKLIEQAADRAGDNIHVFDKSKVLFEGKAISMARATASLTYNNESTKTSETYELVRNLDPKLREQFGISTEYTSIGRPLMEFFQAFGKAQDAGALNNPEAQAIVTGLAKDIAGLTLNVANTSARIYLVKEFTPAEFRKQQASNLTHSDSAAICTTGGSEDNGRFCPKT